MKKLSFILTIIIGLGLSSCSSVGRYANPSQNLNLNQTQVVLSEANFRVVKHVSTSVIYTQSAMRFDADQLQQSAYAELLRKAKLTGSQALINVTVELVARHKSSMKSKTEWAILVSGLVIEFINPNAPQDDVVIGGSIGSASLNSGGTIQGASKSVQTTSNNVTDESTLQNIPSAELQQPTLEELQQAELNAELNKEYLALKAMKGGEFGDKSRLGTYKRAKLVVIDAGAVGEKNCKRCKTNFMNSFNTLMYQQYYKNFTLNNTAKDLTAELVIISYDNDKISGFIRFKDASDNVLYSVYLKEATAQDHASLLAGMIQNIFSKLIR